MGEVWKARDTRLDRDVALKVSKSEFTARFDREARAIAAFNHPNICQLYDVARDGRFLIDTELDDASTEPIHRLLNWKPPAK
jgi:serine/threonine protein kinase